MTVSASRCRSTSRPSTAATGSLAKSSSWSRKLDILVNNAGAAWGAEFDEFPESGWDKVMDLNVKSLFFLTKALAKPLRAAASHERPAKVINIASVDGIFVNPGETYSYAASKAAVIHLTRRMATKLIKDNINVTAIAPGAFKSDMNRAARDHSEDVAKRIPARRIGTDEDMAGVAIYLASRAGDYVVGNTIAVDGGVGCTRTRGWRSRGRGSSPPRGQCAPSPRSYGERVGVRGSLRA
ncbi:NAD(P)-dependent dehydrogenase (short-subunit alcohol dehydrogenase family) [Bradyrhizobium sp. F1.13.1]